ncbi:endoglucanase 9-like [Canna indica]|uniref:Endoglucanase n=1 Tax=Canna indica TaxID=4628 RepID=A0AAQ3Q771_9LILI|nr:endoglucanase 9-like [Canna indica]
MGLETILALGVVIAMASGGVYSTHNYREALSKSLIFFQGQRSGKLPTDQSLIWRANSALSDGSADNVDLTGGYYDAGDNVKFGLPMAFTTTMLAWSVLEFGKSMPKELDHAREAVRWGTDYLLKASAPLPSSFYVQVGDPNADHGCWERPEDMSTPRSVYKVTPSKPGTEVAAETAAALAAAALVFRTVDGGYSKKLLRTAEKAFAFANRYRGNYSDSLSSVVCPFYCSYSGFQDELLWGAAWLYKATHNSSYLSYAQSLDIDYDSDTFSWDNKIPGAAVLLSRGFILEKNEAVSEFKHRAEKFVCSVLPRSPFKTVIYTPGGLMYKMNGSNLQYVTSSTFLLSAYAKYLKISKQTSMCGDLAVTPLSLRGLVRKQVDYILGDNPNNMSYMVGFGDRFPQRIHHRGSSIPSVGLNAEAIGCEQGFSYYYDGDANPNVLTGAVVGGPDANDEFADDRENYSQSEPATYINAPLVGTLAFLAAGLQP